MSTWKRTSTPTSMSVLWSWTETLRLYTSSAMTSSSDRPKTGLRSSCCPAQIQESLCMVYTPAKDGSASPRRRACTSKTRCWSRNIWLLEDTAEILWDFQTQLLMANQPEEATGEAENTARGKNGRSDVVSMVTAAFRAVNAKRSQKHQSRRSQFREQLPYWTEPWRSWDSGQGPQASCGHGDGCV